MLLCVHAMHTVTALNSPAESHLCWTHSSLRSFLLLVQLPYKLEERRGNLQSCVRVENSPSCCAPPQPASATAKLFRPAGADSSALSLSPNTLSPPLLFVMLHCNSHYKSLRVDLTFRSWRCGGGGEQSVSLISLGLVCCLAVRRREGTEPVRSDAELLLSLTKFCIGTGDFIFLSLNQQTRSLQRVQRLDSPYLTVLFGLFFLSFRFPIQAHLVQLASSAGNALCQLLPCCFLFAPPTPTHTHTHTNSVSFTSPPSPPPLVNPPLSYRSLP